MAQIATLVSGSGGSAPRASAPAVPLEIGNGAEIAAALADAQILRGTPTGPALRAAGDLLESDPGEHRVVILATDGRRLRLNGVACLAPPGEAHQVDVTWYCE